MNILFLSSEVAPFAKTGGLGDVAAALPRQLHKNGHDVRLFLPLYSRIDTAKFAFRKVESLKPWRVNLGSHSYEVAVFAARLPGSELDVFFLHCPALYGRQALYSSDGDEHLRFLVLSHAALQACQQWRFKPDVVHCNDWQTALVPLMLKTRYAWDEQVFGRTKSVLTIHNLNYQGRFPSSTLPDTGMLESASLFHQDQLKEGLINHLLHGILYANAITTVSPTYAREIQGSEYGVGLDGFLRGRGRAVLGILNGVDYDEWSPQVDKHLPVHFGPDNLGPKEQMKEALLRRVRLPYVPGVPLFGIVSRLAGQKGFELLDSFMPRLLDRERMQLVVLGNGERRLARMFFDWQRRFRTQVHFHNGFSNELAHWIEAGSDFFVMPSRYEPCGLNQMYSLKYGTVPIVRRTGGLNDTVELWNPRAQRGTGIVFDTYDSQGLRWAMGTALDVYKDRAAYRRLQQNGMAQDFSWQHQAKLYEQLYRAI